MEIAVFIAKGLGRHCRRAQGNDSGAKKIRGFPQESLYRALSGERSPSFDTILKVVTVLGLKLKRRVRR